MATVRWSDNALGDLEAICLYIGRSAPAAAGIPALQAFEAAQRLELFPEMGRPIPDARDDNARELILGNYRLAYRVTGDLVEVLAVHHGARRQGNFEGS